MCDLRDYALCLRYIKIQMTLGGKGLLTWGYRFFLILGAKNCLTMNLKSNYLNKWTLGKGKQKTNRRPKKFKAAGRKQAKITKAKIKHSYLLTFAYAGEDL